VETDWDRVDEVYQERKDGEIQRYQCNKCVWRTCHVWKRHVTFCKCDEGLEDDWEVENIKKTRHNFCVRGVTSNNVHT